MDLFKEGHSAAKPTSEGMSKGVGGEPAVKQVSSEPASKVARKDQDFKPSAKEFNPFPATSK